MFYDIDGPIAIAMIIVLVLMVIVGIWASILHLQIFFRYRRNNRIQIGGMTARQAARDMLDKLGYTDIEVARASWLMWFFFKNWGNRYSPRRKKIFLFSNIIDSSTVTAIALATQKVGLVIQHKEGDAKMAFRAKWEVWTRPAPNLLLPIITIGLIIDVLINWASGTVGTITLVFVIISIIYTIIAMVCLYLVIPTEKRAGELALEKIQQYGLVPAEHIPAIQQMYGTYVKWFISDFLLALLSVIFDLLWLASRFRR